MRKFISILLVFLLCGWTVQVPHGTYAGPGDIISFTFWHGLRAYSNAIAAAGTQPLIRIRNPTSGELCDVLVAHTGGMGLTSNCTSTGAGQTVSSFCGGVDCKVNKVYDQLVSNTCTAGSCDVVQATAGNQPTLLASDNYNSIVNPGSTAIFMQSAANYSPGAILSMTIAAVGNKTGQFDQNIYAAQGSRNLINGIAGTANTWQLIGTTGPTVSATDSAWHSATALLRGSGNAGICLSTSCAAFTSTCLVTTTAGRVQILSVGNNSAVDRFREGGAAASHIATAAEASAINLQASTYWGFTPP